MHRAEMQALTPSFRWDDYLRAIGQPALDDVNVTEPEFYKQVEKTLAGESLDDLKTYLRWQLAHNRARYLSSPFVNESFDFFSAYLRGVKEQQPRWKRCVSWVDRDVGEALGQVFVRKAFPPDRKASTVEMVRQIEAAMEQRIKDLPWMGAATKEQALAKLHGMANKIGYPDHWRDYTALEVRRGDFVGDVDRAVRFESRRQLDKIGKPVDKGEWGMTPPTVNAYYNALMNDMNFPAGVLLPPLYDPTIDAAPNYGNTGTTIGHELTHGFDDEGRQFDAHSTGSTRSSTTSNSTASSHWARTSPTSAAPSWPCRPGATPPPTSVSLPPRASPPTSASSSASRSGPAATSGRRASASTPSPTRTRRWSTASTGWW